MSKEAERAALAAAKEKLVREGELYRVSVVHARAQVANALRPDALVHGMIDHALGAVHQRFSALFGSHGGAGSTGSAGGAGGAGFTGLLGRLGGLAGLAALAKRGLRLKRVLPMAVSVGSFIARKRLVKPVLIAGALAAAGGYWLMHHDKEPPPQ
jgi:hypothetical protein